MLCPTCKTMRPANFDPCPQCHAPSPMQSDARWTGYDGNAFSAANPTQNDAYSNSLWAQVMAPQEQPGQVSTQLAPYYGQQPAMPVIRAPEYPAVYTGDNQTALAPVAPAEDAPIHIPPLYTKPRPIIPRYRIISGFISFFVVIGLLCGGGIYAAKVTGHLNFLQQIFNPQFQNLPASPVSQLPVPTNPAALGPASTIITSATTASSISNSQPRIATNKFTVGNLIYVTYSVHAKTAGKVTLKWYTNGQLYQNSPPQSIPLQKNGNSVSSYTAIVYSRPAEGIVEIYWNNQLAIRLYFVVEPMPS
jgi:hypothetical protein